MKRIRLLSYLVLAMALGTLVSYAQPMTIVNGASFDPNGPFAPGSFAAMFGERLCAQTAAGEWIGPGQLPTELGGCSVSVNGVPAMMHYTSRNQINFIVPDGLGPGRAQVVTRNGPNSIEGTMQVGRAGPGIFARNGMGMGLGAMLHSTLWQDGPFSVTTNGQPTHVSIYMTGLDLTTGPVVDAGGVPVEVTWFGNVPGFVGLQQINIVLPEEMAGAGMTPMTVTSGGVTSNVTYMNILPTTSMMEDMPGWGPGMEVGQNGKRGREMSYLAFNESNNTALVTDEEDDALRVISMDSFETVQTITLPENSEAHAVAVNAAGTLAAVALSHNAAVALINLQQPDDISVIGTGTYPRHLAFVGADLLVTNAASGTVTVIDTTARVVTRTIAVGFGPTGIAADQTRAVVCNTQAGSVSVINLADYSVKTLDLAPGARPHAVAIDSALNKAVITVPQSNSFQILNLDTSEFTEVETEIWNARGPGAVVTYNSRAYIANQMTASITAVDLNTYAVMNTFRVDPGPRALAADPARNRLLVLSHGTGVLSAVDLESLAVVGRADATDGDRDRRWMLPTITSVTPSSAQRGTTFTMTITGNNLHDVEEIEFHVMGPSAGPGPMGSMGPGSGGMMNHDENIETSNLQVSQDGAQITVTVEVLAEAALGTRRIGLETDRGDIMAGPMFDNWFTVTE